MSEPQFESMKEAKQYLRDNWLKGVNCPCCGQRVQCYRHKVNSQMAKCLIDMYRLRKDDWVHVLQELKPSNRMYSLARFWGLIEAKGDETDGDKKSSGYWKLTLEGRNFVEGRVEIPKYSYIYNDKKYGTSKEEVSIQEALGDKFNYNELMGF